MFINLSIHTENLVCVRYSFRHPLKKHALSLSLFLVISLIYFISSCPSHPHPPPLFFLSFRAASENSLSTVVTSVFVFVFIFSFFTLSIDKLVKSTALCSWLAVIEQHFILGRHRQLGRAKATYRQWLIGTSSLFCTCKLPKRKQNVLEHHFSKNSLLEDSEYNDNNEYIFKCPN